MSSTINFAIKPVYKSQNLFTSCNLQWNHNGTLFFSGCNDCINVIDPSNWSIKYKIRDPADNDEINISAYLIVENLAYVCYVSGLCKIFVLPRMPHEKPYIKHQWKVTDNTCYVSILAHNSKRQLLVMGMTNNTTVIWNRNGNRVYTIKGAIRVTSLNFELDNILYIGYERGEVNRVLLKKDSHNSKLETDHHNMRVTSFTLSADKSKIFSTSTDGKLSLIDVKTNTLIDSVDLKSPLYDSVTHQNKEDNIYLATDNGLLYQFDVKAKKHVKTINFGHHEPLMEILFNPVTLSYLLCTGNNDILVIDAIGDKLSSKRAYVGYFDQIYGAEYISEATNCIAICSNSKHINIFNINNHSSILTEAHEDMVTTIHSPSWNDFIFGSGSKDKNIKIWYMVSSDNGIGFSLKCLAFGSGHTDQISCLKFCNSKSSSQFVVTVSADNTLKLWDISDAIRNEACDKMVDITASSTLLAHSNEIMCLDISSNDTLCVTGSKDKSAKLWHIKRSNMKLGIVGTLKGHTKPVWCVKFCETTSYVCTGCGDHKIRMFNISDLDCIQTFDEHEFGITQINFVPNRKAMISCDTNGIIKTWNLNKKTCEKTYDNEHDGFIWTTCVVPRKNKPTIVITGGNDGKFIIWQDCTEEEQQVFNVQIAEHEAKVQSVKNLIEQKKYKEGFLFAIELEQPFMCLKIIKFIIEEENNALEEIVSALDKTQLARLLDYLSQWITTKKYFIEASFTLNILLRELEPMDVINNINSNIIFANLSYGMRHRDRLINLHDNFMLISKTYRDGHLD
uniref:Transducin beta-like protein 3 (inferred by orthology to a human protein) n=1 Tax=Strongyloides venezuelensis TaxID=75913 RepID=A0A0K0F831_STRVS